MNRKTFEKDGKVFLWSQGQLKWRAYPRYVLEAHEDLAAYERTGLTPDEISALNIESEKLFDMLNRFYRAASKIDLAYCMLADGDHSGLSGEEYERLMDVFVEVEEVIEEVI